MYTFCAASLFMSVLQDETSEAIRHATPMGASPCLQFKQEGFSTGFHSGGKNIFNLLYFCLHKENWCQVLILAKHEQ